MDEWKAKLVDWCHAYNIEAEISGTTLKLIGNRAPCLDSLKAIIPSDLVVEFERGPKDESMSYLKKCLETFGYKSIKYAYSADGTVHIDVIGKETDSRMGQKLMVGIKESIKDDFITEIRLSYKERTPDIKLGKPSPLPASPATFVQAKRPDRECISKDEVMDLKIKLGQCNTIEDFLQTI
jgi:hypothetical protein